MKTFWIKTFGCKLNQSDSSSLHNALTARGMSAVPSPEAADLLLVNTCTVTHKADAGARKQIRALRRLSPDARIVVTGCYAERDREMLSGMPEVDRVFGLTQRRELHQYLTGIVPENLDFGDDFQPDQYGDRSRAVLKVQEGCDLKCSFCVITQVRGNGRSLPAEEVVRRLQRLRREGFEEVMLTGIHLGLWGRDLGIRGVGKGMLHLLKTIVEAEDIPRVRLNSLEPYVIKDEFLDLMSATDRIARHLHLSIQSGSERILRRMRRRPHVAQMYHVARRAAELMPECGIGADVIVGFPGETEEDFQETVNLMTDASFNYAHVFSFSPRPGTDAAKMDKQVHDADIKERNARLRLAMDDANLRFRRSLIGKHLPAIALRQFDEQKRQMMLTDNYIHVAVERPESAAGGTAQTVRLVQAENSSTLGELVA